MGAKGMTMLFGRAMGAAVRLRARMAVRALRLRRWVAAVARGERRAAGTRLRLACGETSGQGTTEYAILVGVLVLMAIIAIVAFRDRLQQLWDDITSGINSL